MTQNAASSSSMISLSIVSITWRVLVSSGSMFLAKNDATAILPRRRRRQHRCAGIERRDGHRGLTLQQPADDQVADAHQEANRGQPPHLVDAGGIVLRGHQVAGHGGGHTLDVLERLGQQLALRLQPAVARLAGDERLDLTGTCASATPLSRTIFRKKKSCAWMAVVPS